VINWQDECHLNRVWGWTWNATILRECESFLVLMGGEEMSEKNYFF
jgi:hypothetical protein